MRIFKFLKIKFRKGLFFLTNPFLIEIRAKWVVLVGIGAVLF
ncbi:hypothetical protein Pf1_02796 [Flavobacterium columnare]|nr:hypothetical protein Pf1_02796 [Flavobacterium columnare]